MALPTSDNTVNVTRFGSTLSRLWTKIKTKFGTKADLDSPAFTGTPTAPTAADGTNTTQIATTAFVKQAVIDGMATTDAMEYKGTITLGTTSPGAYTVAASKGHTYKVVKNGNDERGYVDGVAVEAGDMIICNADSTAAATSSNYSTIATKWDFVQGNLDGVVIGPASAVDGQIPVFDGATGKLIKNSGKTLTVTSTSVSDGTTTFNKYTHPTTSGNKHIPSGGSSGQFLGWDSDGTAKWVSNPNTDIKVKATAKTDNVNYKVLATASSSPTSGNATEAVYDTDITLNPSTNTISANISGNAATATTAQNYDTSTGTIKTALDGKVDFGLSNNSSSIGNDAPAADCISYWGSDNIPNNHIKMVYNQPGYEATLIFSKRSTYGSIVKYGYEDKYIYILRNQNGTWKSNDWEKISAGYADSAETATNSKSNYYKSHYSDSNTNAYGWRLGFSEVDTTGAVTKHQYLKAVVHISLWTSAGSSNKSSEFFGFMEINHRNNGTTEVYDACLHSINNYADSNSRGWSIVALRGDAGQLWWYIRLNTNNSTTTFNWADLSIFPLYIGGGFTFDETLAIRTTNPGTGVAIFHQRRAPFMDSTQYGVGSSVTPVYVDSNGQIQKCSGVKELDYAYLIGNYSSYTTAGDLAEVYTTEEWALVQVSGRVIFTQDDSNSVGEFRVTMNTQSGTTAPTITSKEMIVYGSDSSKWKLTANTGVLSSGSRYIQLYGQVNGGYCGLMLFIDSVTTHMGRRPNDTSIYYFKVDRSSATSSSTAPGTELTKIQLLRKDASNVINNNDGTGTTATLLGNTKESTNTPVDDTYIVSSAADGSTDGKWYRRKLSTLWPWITSHHQVSLFKASSDVYVRVGADSNHCIYLDYDASGTSPNMGLWARWGSGSNAKWMAQCDSSGNCTFNGTASGSLNKDASNAICNSGTGTAPTLLDGLTVGSSNITSGDVYIPTTYATGQAQSSWYKRSLSNIKPYFIGYGFGRDQVTQTDYSPTIGISYGDFYNNNTAIYGWKIGHTKVNSGYDNRNFMAIVVITDWATMSDYAPCTFIGVLDLKARMNCSQANVSVNYWQFIGRLTSIVPQRTTSSSKGWKVFAKATSTSTYEHDWYIGRDTGSTSMDGEIKYSKITIFPLFENPADGTGWTRTLTRVTSVMTFTGTYDDTWAQYVTPAIANTDYSVGSSSLPIYIDSNKTFKPMERSIVLYDNRTGQTYKNPYMSVRIDDTHFCNMEAWNNNGTINCGIYARNGSGSAEFICYKDSNGANWLNGTAMSLYDHNNGGVVKLEVGRIGTDANTLYII